MDLSEGKSEFLTDTARGYDSRIIVVSFSKLQGNRGQIWKPKSPYDDGLLRIEIDATKMICVHQILFTFFHEVGHAVLGHCDPRPILRTPEFETAADYWALRKMGILDHNGEVKKTSETCYHCIIQQAKTCLKGLNLEGLA